ncbi:MAG: hypothetical protein EBS29_05345 [Chloroflexia bacterium]|nr:hypothetical protein [Chloroflexia bacterium]
MPRFRTDKGQTITTGPQLGAGGEGAVFDVVGQPSMVAKIYHPHRLNAALAAKVTAMVADPPDDDTRAKFNHVSIAWPEAVLLNGTSFVGYLMPKIPKSDDLYDLLQPQQRALQHPTLNHRHLYRSARNLALAMAAIHRKGYVIGDVNFKNALFNDDALITVVDCDSMQVTDAQNVVHRCLVGIPEYTSPELQGQDFAKVNRTANNDAFGLAVLTFQLLMQGFHPFAGRPLPGAPDVEQVHVYCITQKIFPYVTNKLFAPPTAAPPIGALPAVLQNLFSRAFLTTNRPTPNEWADTIEMIESRLVQCSNNPDHWYPNDGACVICEVDYNVGRRKRPASAPTQPMAQMQVPLSGLPATTPAKPATHQPAPVSTRSPAPSPTFRVPQTLTPVKKPPPTKPAIPVIPPAQATPPSTPPQLSVPSGNLSGGLWWAWIVSTITGMWRSTLGKIVLIGAIIGMCGIGSTLVNTPSTSTTTSDSSASGINSMVATDIPAEIPTNEPVATAISVLAPTAQPTAAVVLPACDADGIVAAAWPMLNPTAQKALRITSIDGNLANRYGASIDITNQLVATSAKKIAPEKLLSQCGDGTGVMRAPFGTAAGMLLECQLNNTCTQQAAVIRQAQLLIRSQTLFGEFNIDTSKSLLSQFSQRSVNKNTITVAVLSSNINWESLVAPLIHTPLVTISKSRGVWKNPNELISTTVQLDTGALVYDDERGITALTQPTSLNQLSRTIDVSKIAWNDGTALTANDYVRWFANCSSSNEAHCAFIASVVPKSTSKITITYIPGLPATLANLIAPDALKGSDQRILDSQSGDWQVISRSGDTLTLQNATNTTLKIQLIDDSAMQPFLDDLRQNGSDLVIVAPEFSAAIATAIAAQPLPANYAIELVPTGAIYTYKTP